MFSQTLNPIGNLNWFNINTMVMTVSNERNSFQHGNVYLKAKLTLK